MSTKWIAPIVLAPAVAAGTPELDDPAEHIYGSALNAFYDRGGVVGDIPDVPFGEGWIYVSFPGHGVFPLPEVTTEGSQGWTVLQSFGGTLDGFIEIRMKTNMPTEFNEGVVVFMPPAERCVADLNNDGGVDLSDIFVFLDAFSNNDPLADLNIDGSVDFLDVFMFVDGFTNGC